MQMPHYTFPTDNADNMYVLNYCFDEYKDKPGNNIIDLNEKELDKNFLQPSFQYYQNHEFHKLSQNLKINKMFNILHTNICSLNANLENLELLLNNLEHSWNEILLENNPNILIGVFYRHPKKASDNTFLEQLKCSLSKIKIRSKYIIFCGDFNYHILKYEYNNFSARFLNLMYSNFLQPCITEPTQIVPGNRPSLVDNTFINNIDKNLHSGNLLDKLTDHLPNFVIIENMNKKTSKQKIKVRDMIHFTLDENLAYLKDLDSVLLQDFSNVNDMFKSYQRN